MEPAIINRGRGPEIAGTRITVYDVLDYSEEGWHRDAIAVFFRLSSMQVQCALDYIASHREEVDAEYQRIMERIARGNPPEVQARLDAGYERLMALARQRESNGSRGESHDRSSAGQ